MKSILFILSIFLLSCNASYQVVETNSSGLKTDNDKWYYDTTNVKVYYDFWEEGSVMNFRFFNKSAVPIYLDMSKSHLIVNDRSYDYYSETTFSNSSTSVVKFRGTYNAMDYASGNAITRKRPKIIQVPPMSYALIDYLPITTSPVTDCGLRVSSSHSSKTYNQNSSPLIFRNYITYDKKEDFSSPMVIDNLFWVEKVSNMTAGSFGQIQDVKECDDSHGLEMVTKYKKPQNFYFNIKKK